MARNTDMLKILSTTTCQLTALPHCILQIFSTLFGCVEYPNWVKYLCLCLAIAPPLSMVKSVCKDCKVVGLKRVGVGMAMSKVGRSMQARRIPALHWRGHCVQHTATYTRTQTTSPRNNLNPPFLGSFFIYCLGLMLTAIIWPIFGFSGSSHTIRWSDDQICAKMCS